MNLLEVVTNRIFSRLALVADSREYARLERFGLGATLVEARRRDGTVLRGYKVPAKTADAPTVVFYCGNTGNASAHFPYIEILHRADCNVIALDYGGYGVSDGKADFSKLLEDAHIACDVAHREFGEDRPDFRIGLFGLSIGANIALRVGAQREDIRSIAAEGLSILQELIRGITLTGFVGPRSVTRLTIDGEDLPEREAISFPGIRGPRPIASFLATAAHFSYPFEGKDPCESANALRVPVLVAHGTSDRIFPFEAALEVYRRCPPGSKLWLLPGIGHAQEPALNSDEEYAAQLRTFFRDNVHVGPEVRTTKNPDGEFQFELGHAREPGAFLVALISEERVDFHRAWLEPDNNFRVSHDDPAAIPVALRMHCAKQSETGWEPVQSERARLFESIYGEHLRNLSRNLHASKVESGLEALEAFARLDPPFPFSHIGALHAARLEALAQKKQPEIVQRATELFAHFQNTGSVADYGLQMAD